LLFIEEARLTTQLNVLTGATGLLGSHIVEQLVGRGERVRCLVRSTSDLRFLRTLDVELVTGDLAVPASVREVVRGADVVYHCAAKVGEWGPWSDYRAHVLDATANLLDACRTEGVGRVLHVSSITVYGHLPPRSGLFTEEEPLGQNLWVWDHYCRAKIGAEELCRQYPGAWTMIRPTWMYGPRDRNALPRLFKALLARRVRLIGDGNNLMNLIYAADVADAAIRAANLPTAIGEAYNLSSAGEITQRQFFDALTDMLALPRLKRRVRFGTAFWVGWISELVGHAIRLQRPPHITRYGVSLFGRSTQFSVEKARRQLGWEPRVAAPEGLRRTLEWYRAASQAIEPAVTRS
jgi:nucleoside-diphosphate-sugar epimerase